MRSMFCENCGTKLPDNAKFCVSCGASRWQEALEPSKKKIMDFLMIPVAIILILLGIGSMALAVAGRTVIAQVTGYEQVMYLNNDDSTRNPRRYQLDYQFAVKGERYTGSVTRVFEKGSHLQKILRVRYLSFWPHVNAEDGTMGMVLAGPVLIGVGILLLVSGVKKKPRFRNKS